MKPPDYKVYDQELIEKEIIAKKEKHNTCLKKLDMVREIEELASLDKSTVEAIQVKIVTDYIYQNTDCY